MHNAGTHSEGRLFNGGGGGRLGVDGGARFIVCAHKGGSEQSGGTNCETHCGCLLSERAEDLECEQKWTSGDGEMGEVELDYITESSGKCNVAL